MTFTQAARPEREAIEPIKALTKYYITAHPEREAVEGLCTKPFDRCALRVSGMLKIK